MDIPLGLTFDDVLLVPAYSEVHPRDVDTSTRLTRDVTLNAGQSCTLTVVFSPTAAGAVNDSFALNAGGTDVTLMLWDLAGEKYPASPLLRYERGCLLAERGELLIVCSGREGLFALDDARVDEVPDAARALLAEDRLPVAPPLVAQAARARR